ncbi:MAG: rRNA ((527)-N(7))-methyltransferase RsmG [Planctomycetota bacterium]
METGIEAILERYARMVADSPHNLVSRAARAELSTRHVPEAVRFARELPGPGRLLDVGSGGGLPGVVIAIVRPDLEVHLLEATGKKVAFLEETSRTLEVPVRIHLGRAEALASGPLGGSFDLVTARAVAPLDRLVRLTVPFLAPGGSLHALKGARWAEELTAAHAEIRRRGLVVASTPAQAPSPAEPEGQDGGPTVIVLTRVSP